MKNSIFKFVMGAVLISLFHYSCGKKNIDGCNCKTYTAAEVFKDCTGTYIRVQTNDSDNWDKEYLVCNPKMFNKYNSGDKVSVCYKPTDKCNCSEGEIVCEMLHEHDGLVSVSGVK